MEKEKHDQVERVRVGSRSALDYVGATIYSLQTSNSPFVIVEGLGRWTGKVLEVATLTARLVNARTGDVESFEVDGTPGIRVKMFRASKRGPGQ